MYNIYKTNSSVKKPTGDMRSAAFEQRRNNYVQCTYDRPAVFIDNLNITNRNKTYQHLNLKDKRNEYQ